MSGSCGHFTPGRSRRASLPAPLVGEGPGVRGKALSIIYASEILSMSNRIPRREFLSRSAVAGAAVGLGVWSSRSLAESKSPNEKLNIAMVGTANQARFSIDNVKQENIVALCDIDDDYLAKAKRDFPRAKAYNDFRKLLEQNDIEAVVVAVPDHIHPFATAGALHLGKHVYCEKPLTHTVSEARAIAELAAKMKVATQMGTQIHAGENYRHVVELFSPARSARSAKSTLGRAALRAAAIGPPTCRRFRRISTGNSGSGRLRNGPIIRRTFR